MGDVLEILDEGRDGEPGALLVKLRLNVFPTSFSGRRLAASTASSEAAEPDGEVAQTEMPSTRGGQCCDVQLIPSPIFSLRDLGAPARYRQRGGSTAGHNHDEWTRDVRCVGGCAYITRGDGAGC